MTAQGTWDLFWTNWPMSVTMVFGSFIAGSTPAGGGAVAFPVFTKLLEVSTPVARTFSLMIQSVGMTMASIFILSRRIPVSMRAIRLCLGGAGAGFLLALATPAPPDPYPRIFFTTVAVFFGVAMIYTHWVMGWRPKRGANARLGGRSNHLHLMAIGLLGGYVSGQIGSGVDLLTFVALTMAYGLHERYAIATSVLIMTAISLLGTAMLLLTQHESVPQAYSYWLVCVPVVAVGAPFGAWLASRMPRPCLMTIVLLLILAEAVTTALLVDWTLRMLKLGFLVGLITVGYFAWMVQHRRHLFGPRFSASASIPSRDPSR